MQDPCCSDFVLDGIAAVIVDSIDNELLLLCGKELASLDLRWEIDDYEKSYDANHTGNGSL